MQSWGVLEAAESGVCSAGVKCVWLMNHSADWFSIVLGRIKGVSATFRLSSLYAT